MLIKVENKGITINCCADMSVMLIKNSEDILPDEVYYLAALNALKDSNERAFFNALEAFFKSELEQLHDEE